MKLPFFSNKTSRTINEGEPMLALDVGTTFVKSLLFEVRNGQILVKGYGKIRQKPDTMKGAMIINLASVVETCDLAIGEAVKDYQGDLPDRVIMGMAGELVRGVTIMANYEREDPKMKIDKEELNAVVAKVRENAFSDAVDEIADETGLHSQQIEEISSVINDTYIDGFRVRNPLEFQGTDVTFRVFSTFAPSIHTSSLKTIANELKLKIYDIVVEPYAITRAFKGASKDEFSAIFIDVGGGTTDVAIVHNGGIIGTKMFAFGGNLFTKRIQKLFEVDYKTAEDYKIRYSEGKLDEIKSKKIKSAYYNDAKIWVDGVELALKDFDDVKSYPTQIYLCGGGSLLPEIKTALREHPWLQVIRVQKFPDIEFIQPEQLDMVMDDLGFIKESSDIAPVALARMVLDADMRT